MAKHKKLWLTPLLLICVIVLLHIIAVYTDWIENFYSTHIYVFISSLLRLLTGWIPFSLGDVLYAAAAVWFIFKIISFFRSRLSWRKFFLSIRNFAVKILWVYVFFLVMWGLNYYRFGIGYQLQLDPKPYDADDLKKITAALVLKLNSTSKTLDSLHENYPDNKIIFNDAIGLYDSVKNKYPFLDYRFPDVKKMLSGTMGNYSGFLGYYNPFTGEAQVNTTVPNFVIPFTACHEMAHQIGYASESEASFIGFLAITNGNNLWFRYSAYFDLYVYANSELFVRDSAAARQNHKNLDTLVKKDLAVYRSYFNAYQNPVEPLLSVIYGGYLKAHNQPKGIESYDEVVAWIVAYFKRYGSL